MKNTLFYKILRRLKFFRSNELRLEPLKVESGDSRTVFGKISLIKEREMEVRLKSRSEFLKEWNSTKNIEEKSVLFTGPHGSGQVISAGLLGKFVEKEIYRIDLSGVASKYIGETEKNLQKIFDQAAGKDWILFFDEADALFGKRTDVKDSHDKYANQEVSYLLQKIDEYPLPVIVSIGRTNVEREILDRFRLRLRFPLRENDEKES